MKTFARTTVAALVTGLALLVAGCSGIKPLIQGGTYIDTEHHYSFTLPSGWAAVDRIPKTFRTENAPIPTYRFGERYIIPDVTEFFIQYTDGILMNPDSLGVVAIRGAKRDYDWSRLDQEALGRILQEGLERERVGLSEVRYVEDYTYRGYPVKCSPRPALVAEREFRETNDRRRLFYLLREFAFQCDGDQTCSTLLMLISDEETVDTNLQAFDTLCQSIRSKETYERQPDPSRTAHLKNN